MSGHDNNNQTDKKCSVPCALFAILMFFLGLSLIICIYFFFSNFLQYTTYPILYGWISICFKTELYQFILGIISFLSDYGYFFFLITVTFHLVLNIKEIFLGLLTNFSQFCNCSKEETDSLNNQPLIKEETDSLNNQSINNQPLNNQPLNNQSPIKEETNSPNDESQKELESIDTCGILIIFFFISLIFTGLFIYQVTFVNITICNILFLLMILLSFWICIIHKICPCCFSDLYKHLDPNEKKNDSKFNVIFDFVISYDQMIFGNRQLNCCCCKKSSPDDKGDDIDTCDSLYSGYCTKILFSLLVFTGQLITIVQGFRDFKNLSSYGKWGVVIGFFFRFYSLPRIIDLNFYDSLFYVHRIWKKITSDIDIWPYIISMATYIILFIAFIVIRVIAYAFPQPTISNLSYSFDDTIWYRNRNNSNIKQYNIPEICSIPSEYNYGFGLDDYAVLQTLPRLYEVDKDYTCRIKPYQRGVFNSTMKYLFGENYSNQNITIMCYPYTHDPFLVLTSDVLTNNYFQDVNTTGGTFLEQQFKPISNSSFSGELCSDGRALDSCRILQECLNKHSDNCSKEWDIYSNNYWETFKNNPAKEPLKGLEQYQITLKFGTILQPRFIDQDHNLLNGPHIIIGGGFENLWGYSYLSENIARAFFPEILGNIIPLYNLVHDYYRDLFIRFSQFVMGFFLH